MTIVVRMAIVALAVMLAVAVVYVGSNVYRRHHTSNRARLTLRDQSRFAMQFLSDDEIDAAANRKPFESAAPATINDPAIEVADCDARNVDPAVAASARASPCDTSRPTAPPAPTSTAGGGGGGGGGRYIVGFRDYKPIESHVLTLQQLLTSAPPAAAAPESDAIRMLPPRWTHIPRQNAAMRYPTDFVLIEFDLPMAVDPVLTIPRPLSRDEYESGRRERRRLYGAYDRALRQQISVLESAAGIKYVSRDSVVRRTLNEYAGSGPREVIFRREAYSRGGASLVPSRDRELTETEVAIAMELERERDEDCYSHRCFTVPQRFKSYGAFVDESDPGAAAAALNASDDMHESSDSGGAAEWEQMARDAEADAAADAEAEAAEIAAQAAAQLAASISRPTSEVNASDNEFNRHRHNRQLLQSPAAAAATANFKKSKPKPAPAPGHTPPTRKLLESEVSVTTLLNAQHLWDLGFSGRHVRIGVFDTGLAEHHPHFRNIKERTNWTTEKTLDDGLGHGTFVAGVIASSRECPGFAPDADIHVFRVFTNKQISYTAWFLDAFNYAIHSHIDVLNLSIGGPDFMDRPFTDKVLEMSANNIIVISAIGNDGPLYGTLNNPADQMDVIGVGGIDSSDRVARFSSRGMTTWELPEGYGRVKPDIMAYSKSIRGSRLRSGCRVLTGTSVASPVVAGAVVLLASVVPDHKRHELINPASMKQALIESAVRLTEGGYNIFEQGFGRINLPGAYNILKNYSPRVSIIPGSLDLTDCPYMWPYCTQDIYHTAAPLMLNLTILNGMSVSGSFVHEPEWLPSVSGDTLLTVQFTHAEVIWPWTGYLGVHITVSRPVTTTAPQLVKGVIRVTIVSDAGLSSTVDVPLTVRVIATPHRSRRLLWDQFHNLRYPTGYFPRDNLNVKEDILDWNGDHPHTNFRELYNYLRAEGYFIDVLGRDFTCFDASLYGTLLIVDPEEEYFPEEVEKLRHDVTVNGLNVILIGEWYNTDTMTQLKFFDQNTKRWWTPHTGGANVPAINDLLHPFGLALGGRVYRGEVRVGDQSTQFASGTTIARAPAGSFLVHAFLEDITQDAAPKPSLTLPFLAAFSTAYAKPEDAPAFPNGGRVVVYGDSNCWDMNHRSTPACNWLMGKLLKFAADNIREESSFPAASQLTAPYVSSIVSPPLRLAGNELARYSKVISNSLVPPHPKCMPASASTRYRSASSPDAAAATDSEDANSDFAPAILHGRGPRPDTDGPTEGPNPTTPAPTHPVLTPVTPAAGSVGSQPPGAGTPVPPALAPAGAATNPIRARQQQAGAGAVGGGAVADRSRYYNATAASIAGDPMDFTSARYTQPAEYVHTPRPLITYILIIALAAIIMVYLRAVFSADGFAEDEASAEAFNRRNRRAAAGAAPGTATATGTSAGTDTLLPAPVPPPRKFSGSAGSSGLVPSDSLPDLNALSLSRNPSEDQLSSAASRALATRSADTSVSNYQSANTLTL